MLLVMHTAGILQRDGDETQLWRLTWDRIDAFLPNLRDEVFKPHESGLYLTRSYFVDVVYTACSSCQKFFDF